MATFRIKLHGINNIDMASLKSVLQLSDSRLNNEWVVSQTGQVDLFLYSLDNEESLTLLRSHKRHGISAALAQKNQTNALADFIIKKPIRTKQLAEVLNAAEEKIMAARQSDKPSQKPLVKEIKAPAKSASKPKDKPVKKTSLLGSLSKHLTRRKSPAAGLPVLTLFTPQLADNKLPTITDPSALGKWLKTLPEQDHKASIDALLDKLTSLNRISVSADNRLALLELYRGPIRDYVFERDINTVKLEIAEPSAFEAKINQLSLFIEELVLGYKILIMEAYQSGHRPDSDQQFLLSIIRAAESISLLMTNAFRHYRNTPTGVIHELHQLYLYCEAAKVLDKQASLKLVTSEKPFMYYYSQIMLTGIADPYSLGKYDVFRLFKLMGKMADKIAITRLSEHQRNAENKTAIASHFCLECNTDKLPQPLHLLAVENRQHSETRLLNPQGVLFAIEHIFNAAASTSTLGRYNLDIQLLKKVIPQFNASYQRQYQRMTPTTERIIRLANGFNAIHQSIDAADDSNTTEWLVGNHGEHWRFYRHF